MIHLLCKWKTAFGNALNMGLQTKTHLDPNKKLFSLTLIINDYTALRASTKLDIL